MSDKSGAFVRLGSSYGTGRNSTLLVQVNWEEGCSLPSPKLSQAYPARPHGREGSSHFTCTTFRPQGLCRRRGWTFRRLPSASIWVGYTFSTSIALLLQNLEEPAIVWSGIPLWLKCREWSNTVLCRSGHREARETRAGFDQCCFDF
jgi:hypothetical protein